MKYYEFSKPGIEQFEEECLDDIFDAFENDKPTHEIGELDPILTIGDKSITIPLYSTSFDLLIDCLKQIEEDMA